MTASTDQINLVAATIFFTVPPAAAFTITERFSRGEDGPTITAQELTVHWSDRASDHVQFQHVDVTGPRHRNDGSLGRDCTVRVYHLEQFPPTVAGRIESTNPARAEA